MNRKIFFLPDPMVTLHTRTRRHETDGKVKMGAGGASEGELGEEEDATGKGCIWVRAWWAVLQREACRQAGGPVPGTRESGISALYRRSPHRVGYSYTMKKIQDTFLPSLFNLSCRFLHRRRPVVIIDCRVQRAIIAERRHRSPPAPLWPKQILALAGDP